MSVWLTLTELSAMALPGLPDTRRGLAMQAEREEWTHPDAEGRLWRRRQGRGGGVEYALAVLPSYVQAKILARAAATAAPAEKDATLQRLSDEAAWAAYERQPEKHKARAAARVAALDAVATLVNQGRPRRLAMMEVAATHQVSRSQLYEWASLVDGVPRASWLARLVPQYAGATGARATCSDDAWEWLRARYLLPNQPTFEACWRDLEKVAAQRGWTLPSKRTLRRRIDALPAVVRTWHREGPEATDALFPTQRRDRSMLHAMEWLNADGHRFDNFVEWPDGERARPMVVCFQDLYSGKFLGYRVGPDETGDTFRLAFGDVVEKYGIPAKVTIDNTLAAANKTMSGGLKRRFRFKVRAEEPLGIFPTLGVEVHWAKPYSGRSKPIERAFGDFARDIARHPSFVGAWTGNSTSNKPHDYGSKAVPLATFLAVLEAGIAEHNARPGRTAANCRGRSFDETFAESYAQAPITMASDAQRRVFLLAADEVRVRRDATVHLMGNRYHDPRLVELRGRPVTIRFDPEHLHAPVHIFLASGEFFVTADCIADAGFGDVDAARRTAQANKQRRKGIKLIADAERRIEAEQLARDLADLERPLPPTPAPRVVRPLFRGNAAVKPITDQEEETSEERSERLFVAAHRQLRGAGTAAQLRLVPDEDAEDQA
ncbi:Mu transposase C-terminal domain-containing protein [Roseomonas sp. HJA6]|uniref:Mu transposase C-terminal domain-containing protein n=1 Tax=Roseomonas alba TaxID=2846776 RepID=A0ABS7AB59_9PROT|nr:Mu transposase C-terminal domain-containing protein [Neoroseomonas alba]